MLRLARSELSWFRLNWTIGLREQESTRVSLPTVVNRFETWGSAPDPGIFAAWEMLRILNHEEGREPKGSRRRKSVAPHPAIRRRVASQQSSLVFHRTGETLSSLQPHVKKARSTSTLDDLHGDTAWYPSPLLPSAPSAIFTRTAY